jgi:hypothetical protein
VKQRLYREQRIPSSEFGMPRGVRVSKELVQFLVRVENAFTDQPYGHGRRSTRTVKAVTVATHCWAAAEFGACAGV